MFFSSCDSVVGDFLEFNQANRSANTTALPHVPLGGWKKDGPYEQMVFSRKSGYI